MTISIEQHIEELRLEAREPATRCERRQIGAELGLALAELAVITTEQGATSARSLLSRRLTSYRRRQPFRLTRSAHP
ncbi:hypothetical protein FS763_25900 [Agrobacterium vitis]|nr:hypothetical protein [Allorhizobium ampelinum]